MSRSTSLTFREAVFASETEDAFLILLEIDHADLTSPIRVVNNTESVIFNNNTYIGYPFRLELPSDSPDNIPSATLTIDNVDKILADAINNLNTSPTITFYIVSTAALDGPEATFSGFKFVEATYDSLTITITLSIENFFNEPFPGDYFTPGRFPGLF